MGSNVANNTRQWLKHQQRCHSCARSRAGLHKFNAIFLSRTAAISHQTSSNSGNRDKQAVREAKPWEQKETMSWYRASRLSLTLWSGVDGHSAADQAHIQTAFLVHQAGDSGLVRGEEVLQTYFLGPLTALINDDAEQDGRWSQNLIRTICCLWKTAWLLFLKNSWALTFKVAWITLLLLYLPSSMPRQILGVSLAFAKGTWLLSPSFSPFSWGCSTGT